MSCEPRPVQIESGDALGAPSSRERSWLALMRDALSGAERDYTSGPIGRAVILLAIPMVLEMLMESTFAICDVFFVSRLGVDAVAAVGLTEAILTILYSVASGLAMATTAIVARRIGERRPDRAASATVQAMAIGVALSAVISVPGALFAPHLLRLMGASDAVVATGGGFARVVLGASGTVVMLFVINAAFRGAGDATLAMRTLWLANGVNLVLDPCLIFGLGPFPALGVTGAAVATSIGRGVGVAYQLATLLRARGRIRLAPGWLRLRPRLMLAVLRLSVGGVMQFLVSTASWVALVRIVGSFGSAAVAGYTIAIRLVIFALLPSWGIAGAAATLMGQNLGAGRPDRAERSLWLAAAYSAGLLLAVGALFVVAARPLLGFFTSDAATLAVGIDCLRFVAYGFGFYGLGMVVVQGFNGAGDTATPTLINLACYWALQIPLAYLLAHPGGLGADGAFVAIPLAESVLTIVAVVVFRKGRWKLRKI